MPIDLDKLERLEREATPEPWAIDDRGRVHAHSAVDLGEGMETTISSLLLMVTTVNRDGESNLDLLIALRNAAPALFAELRAARARIAELERDARLGAAVRAAAALEEDGHIAGRTVLHAINSVLREEEGEEAGDAV